MSDASPWSELFAVAQRQHGALHLGQAEALGIAGRSLRRRATLEGWHRPHPGVFVVPGAPVTFPTRCSAALLAARPHAIVERWSALHLYGLMDARPTHVDLVVPDGHRAPRLRRVRSRRSSTLIESDRGEVDGITVTSFPRTLIDLAGVTDLPYLRGRALAGLQRGLATPRDLADRLQRIGPVLGRQKVRRIVEGLERHQPDSGFEHDVRTYLDTHGFGDEMHPTPFPFRCPDGVVVHLDVAMPRWWLALECDSIRWHGTGRAFDTDRLRWSQIQAGGWRIIWVTGRRFREDPGSVLAEIEAHIAAADPTRTPAVPAT